MAHTSQFRQTLERNEEILHVFPLEALMEERRHRKLRTSKTLSGYVAPAKDTITALQICKELGITGRVAVTTAANGRSYVIVKGYPGMRSVLTAPRYLESNVKVVKLAIGRVGITKAIAGGAILTIVLYTGIDVLEYILDDHATLSMLSGTLATDLMKVGISSIAAAAVGLALGTLTTIAAGPLIAAIIVGIGINYYLESIDEQYGMTDKLVAAIDRFGQDFAQKRMQLEESLGRKYHEIEREAIWRMYEFDIDNPNGF